MVEIDWQKMVWDSFESEDLDPPIFDWRKFRDKADKIVARLKADIHHPPAKKRRPPIAGLDLSHLRDEIAQLLADLHEIYITALDDYEMRNCPNKPKKSGPVTFCSPADPDLSDELRELMWETAGHGLPPWEEIYNDCYARKRGNPGRSRRGGPPVLPLHPIYQAVRAWCRWRELGQFTPSFKGRENERENNADSRFLLAIIQSLDPNYDAATAYGLYETMRKKERRKDVLRP